MATKWASASASGGGDGSEGNPYTLAEIQAAAASNDTLVMVGNFDAQSLTLTSLTNVTVISAHCVNPSLYSQAAFRNRSTANSANWKLVTGTSYANYVNEASLVPWKCVVDWDTTSPDAYGFRNCNLQKRTTTAGVDSNSNTFSVAARTITVSAISVEAVNPSTATTTGNHGLTTGQQVLFASNFNTTPSINATTKTVTVIDATHFTFGTVCTAVVDGAGTATTIPGEELYVNIGSDPASNSVMYAVKRTGVHFAGCAGGCVIGIRFEWSCTSATTSNLAYAVQFVDGTGVPSISGCTFVECGWHATGFYGGSTGSVSGHEYGNTYYGCERDSCSVSYCTSGTISNVLYFGNTYYCSTPLKRGASSTPILTPDETGQQSSPAIAAHVGGATDTTITDVKIINCRMICPPYTRTNSSASNAISPILCRNAPAPSDTSNPSTYAVQIINCDINGFDVYIPNAPYAHALVGCRLDFSGTPTFFAGGNVLSVVGRILGGGSNTNGYIGSFGTQWAFDLDTTSGTNPANAFFVSGGVTTANRTFYYFDKSTAYNYGDNSSTSQIQSLFRWTSSVDAAGNGSITASDSVFAHRAKPSAGSRFLLNTDSDVDITVGARGFIRCIYGNIGTYSSNTSYDTEAEWLAAIDTAGQAYAASIIEPVSGSGTLVLGSKYRNPPKGIAPSKTWLGSNGYPTSLSPGSAQFNASRARSSGWSRNDRVSR